MSKDNTNSQNLEPLEAQAKQITDLLDAHAQRLNMRTLKQLEDGRARAVSMHHSRQGGTVNADGTVSQWTLWLDHHRLLFASVLLAAIIGSFVILQNLQSTETSDAFLLGADLPPEAFVDRGFEPSLNHHVSI